MSATEEPKLQNMVETADAKNDSSQSFLPVKHDPLDGLVSNQNGTNGGTSDIEAPKPVKTEGGTPASENSFIPRTLPLTPLGSNPSTSSALNPFSPNAGIYSAQLTADEQAAISRKANVLALSALAKKGGANTKDIFAVQQKLQEFLSSLITLAGQKGAQLKVAIQMMVQNLVVSLLQVKMELGKVHF